jgi:hypothetical protein
VGHVGELVSAVHFGENIGRRWRCPTGLLSSWDRCGRWQ